MFKNEILRAFFAKAEVKVPIQSREEKEAAVEPDVEFNYIVTRNEQDRICFLSGRERYPKTVTAPVNVTYLSPEKCSGINALMTKVRSKRGVGGLANLSPRFQKGRLDDTPGPTKYDAEHKKKVKPSQIPFGTGRAARKIFVNKNPGPGTYDEPWQCRRPVKKYKFGGKMQLSPCVETICYPFQSDKCTICQNICKGDYWHFENSIFICLNCMVLERRINAKFSKTELNKFKKIRNCAYMHQHEGTTAAIRLLPKNALCTKFRIENYLENFFNKYN